MAVVALVVEHRESKRFVRGNGKWRARTSNGVCWGRIRWVRLAAVAVAANTRAAVS